jgi:pyruvate formate lyase activating enzyme
MRGKIHSFETFSTADGPGIRFVAFFQGCNFRCKYCHNPDTWTYDGGSEWRASEVIDKVMEYENFYRSSEGGLTAGGGEPLLQAKFLAELFQLAHEEELHTCLDTAGDIAKLSGEEIENILTHTDLVLLDIKEMDEARHKELVGRDMSGPLKFLQILQDNEIPTRLRYVYIKGINDSKEVLDGIKELKNKFSCVKGIDVLPYHRMGEHKWEALDTEYALAGVEPPTSAEVDEVRDYLCY